MKRFLFIGVFGVAVAALALALNYFSGGEPASDSAVTAGRPAAPAAPNRVARSSGIPVPSPPPAAAFKSGEPARGAEPESADKAVKPAEMTETAAKSVDPKPEAPVAQVSPPTFDVVRVNPAGDAVIAGRAAPGANVTIYDGDQLIGTVTADDRGDWVYLPTEPLPSGKRELSLSARNADGVEARSQSVVVLAVPGRNVESEEDGPRKKAEALAVMMSRDGSKPSRVLQKPTESRGVGGKDLSVGVVDYNEKGDVNIGGKGKPGADVQVYVDNKLVGQAKVGTDGNWTVGPEKKVDPGVHKLRIDSVKKGRVVSRVEIPFSRAGPAAVNPGKALVVVQPGNSLWRIARRTMGKGVRYVEIYNANASKIVDPDLIYPGQVFSLPETN